MAKSAVADPSAPPSIATLIDASTMDDFGDPLPSPPMDPLYFSQNDETLIDDFDLDFDFDFSFDDLNLPDSFLDPNFLPGSVDQHDTGQVHPVDPACYFHPGPGSDLIGAHNNCASDLFQFSGDQINGDAVLRNHSPIEPSSSGSRVLNLDLSDSHQIHGDLSSNLNVPSPESGDGSQGRSNARVLSWPSPESQGSGNCGSDVSAAPNSLSNGLNQSVISSPCSGENSIKIRVDDHNVKSKEMYSNIRNYNNSVLKRKKDDGESNGVKSRMSKCKKPIDISNTEDTYTNTSNVISEEEEKKKARLMRNRESALLSRQRKKHYVEELEGKVRTMRSTIQELNTKISHVMAENASLKQQMGGSGLGVGPTVPPPPPGMYAPVMYPWMPYAPPYMVKPQGSQVPLVPIPRLKPQKTASVTKTSKNVEGKKKEKKTKKVASVSFLGLLFFMFMFGTLVPMAYLRNGWTMEEIVGRNYSRNGFYEKKHHGSVLAANGTNNSLAASLYVPRNDKLVKIDGNLIIHSVLASDKAMGSRGSAETKNSTQTGLAIPGQFAPAIPSGRHPHMYQGDGMLQQWFQQGLSGPMLSSGMCTEVFQFDVSSAITAATAIRNVSMEPSQNTTNTSRGKNRRILHSPIPISASSQNVSEENVGRNEHKGNLNGNKTLSPMVVSVLVDPRDGGDADGETVMGPKSFSRIFVVVLIDSVKYVTYSCMLPFKSSVLL